MSNQTYTVQDQNGSHSFDIVESVGGSASLLLTDDSFEDLISYLQSKSLLVQTINYKGVIRPQVTLT